MVYVTEDELCTYVANWMDLEKCESKMKDFSKQTETILSCAEGDVIDKHKKDNEIVAFMFTEDGCPFCNNQRRMLGNVMDEDKNFTAYDIPVSEETCDRFADEKQIEAVPHTEIYINGKKALEYDQSIDEQTLRNDINSWEG